MIITHVDRAHLEGIVALERSGFAADSGWSSEAWAEELDGPGRCVLAHVDADGRILGVAAFRCVEDMADLNRVVVHPTARRCGVGSSLLRAGMEWAEAVGADRMLLEVDGDNLAAVSLYRRLGFDQISVRLDYYAPGRNALVMVRPLGEDDESWAELG